MQKTILNEIHHALGARMVDFGGWEMPLHYGSQVEEHHKVRLGAGMFDVSHMCSVDVLGPGARSFLSRLLVSSLDKMRMTGKAVYTCMLNKTGGIIDDLIVYYLGESHFRLVVNAATCETDWAWFERQSTVYGVGVTIERRRDLAMIAVQGPEARSRTGLALPDIAAASMTLEPFFALRCGEMLVARTGYTGEDGFEIALPNDEAIAVWQALQKAGVAPCGLGARDTLRLEAGMNLYGQDMDETTTPFESGLSWIVDRDESHDYIGKQVILTAVPSARLTGLLLEPGAGMLRAHQSVFTSHGPGVITSGSFSPTLQRSIALARVPVDTQDGETVEVEIRGKRIPARVVKPPFARKGRVLI